jgi:hypothetical protein
MRQPSALHELLDAGLSSALDPIPVRFRPTDECGVRVVRVACTGEIGLSKQLRRPLNRNAFLFGCLDFLERQPLEHLIVGFGRLARSTTRLEGLTHIVGSADFVQVPPAIWDAAKTWLKTTPQSQVILVHNHPRNMLNAILDNLPIASGTDRDTWITSVLESGPGVRFYLVENGFIREFRTPMIMRLLRQLDAKL